MKRNVLLLIGLLGLLILEYGCKKDPSPKGLCEDANVKVTNLFFSQTFHRDNTIYGIVEPNDTVAFDSFIVQSFFNYKYVKSTVPKSNYAAYAIVAPIAKTCFEVENLTVELEQRGRLEDVTSLLYCYNQKMPYPGIKAEGTQTFYNTLSESLACTPLGLSLYMYTKPEVSGKVRVKITITNKQGEFFVTFSDYFHIR